MNAPVKTLVNAIINDDRHAAKTTLNTIIGTRVNDMLKGKKIEAAQNIFKKAPGATG